MGEVTKLFLETGVITLASFISPYRADRERVRQRMGPKDFIEVYMKVCQVPWLRLHLSRMHSMAAILCTI